MMVLLLLLLTVIIMLLLLLLLSHSRAFHIVTPKIWNSLPASILECQTLTSFRRHLKTHYFQSAYPAPQRPSPMIWFSTYLSTCTTNNRFTFQSHSNLIWTVGIVTALTFTAYLGSRSCLTADSVKRLKGTQMQIDSKFILQTGGSILLCNYESF